MHEQEIIQKHIGIVETSITVTIWIIGFKISHINLNHLTFMSFYMYYITSFFMHKTCSIMYETT